MKQSESDAQDILRTYLDLYVQEEVTTEGLIRNLEAFARFLEAASFSQASVLSVSDIARDSGVKRSTVDGYFAILRDMLLTARLPVFSKRAKRALVSHEKFYFFDCGVFRTLRPKGPLDRPFLLYRGKERFLSDGVLVLPVEDFLRALVPGRPPLDAF